MYVINRKTKSPSPSFESSASFALDSVSCITDTRTFSGFISMVNSDSITICIYNTINNSVIMLPDVAANDRS